MSLAGKKVVCVGGNGYIGNYFVSRLIQAQAQVQILCRYLLSLSFQKWTQEQVPRKWKSRLAHWQRLQYRQVQVTTQ